MEQKFDKTINEKIINYVFVIRISSIGDIIMSLKTLSLLKDNNIEPIFIISNKLFDCAKIMTNLKYIGLYDENNIVFFEKNNDTYVNINIYNLIKNINILILDLQVTNRSYKCVKILTAMFPKFNLMKVYKNNCKRIIQIIKSFLFLDQYELNERINYHESYKIIDNHYKLITKICPNINFNIRNQKVNLTNNILPDINYGEYIVMAIGASLGLKAWPLEYFIDLIKLCINNTKCNIIIIGGKEEYNAGEKIINILNNKRIFNVCGEFSLTISFSLILNAKYLVSNDSFAIHIADLGNIPSTVIFGTTSPLFGFAPISTQINILYANLSCSPCTKHGSGECRFNNTKCLYFITPAQVYTCMKKFIE